MCRVLKDCSVILVVIRSDLTWNLLLWLTESEMTAQNPVSVSKFLLLITTHMNQNLTKNVAFVTIVNEMRGKSHIWEV